MTKAQIHAIFSRLKTHNPTPTTELQFTSHFELLIAVMLSAQATDVSVNRATQKLYPIANTPEAILALGEEGLKQYIKTIGLYNTKTKNILKTCELLIQHHNGMVPRSREALESLPGVGRKTANVILNTAFGEPTIAVDTHIFRVAQRLGLAKGTTPLAIEQGLMNTTPFEFRQDAHHWLILHGRYICKARKPLCKQCALLSLCPWNQKTVE